MDPLTAFSLACGVIQVVDFIGKILLTFKEIHKKGESAENQDLRQMNEVLLDLGSKLGSAGLHPRLRKNN